MSGFGQDLQRLLVSFLPCLGQWCQVPPRATIWAGLWTLAWAGSTHSGPLCLRGCSDLPQGFGTALGVLGVASSLLLTPSSLHS